MLAQQTWQKASAPLLQTRTEIISALADILFLVEPNGRIIDVPTPKADNLFPGSFGQPPWKRPDGSIRPARIWDILYTFGSDEAMMFELGFTQLTEDMLPAELIFEQLPQKITIAERIFAIRYVPICTKGSDTIEQVVIALEDRTPFIEEDRQQAINAEFRSVMEQLMADLNASRAFFDEMRWLGEQLTPDADLADLQRTLHTMKGNLGIFGFSGLSHAVHQIEDVIINGDMDRAWEDIASLRAQWKVKETVYGSFFANRKDQEIVLSREEYEDHVMYLMCQTDYADLLGAAQRWAMDPISQVFSRLAMQMNRICGNLGKQVKIVSEHNNVRLPGTGLQPLWASLTHIVRNAADHGFQDPAGRTEAGKPAENLFTMRSEMDDDFLTMSFIDDGAGINWERVRTKATKLGLPCGTDVELQAALLSDFFSTRDEANAMSGRGVGTTAVRAAVEDLGGTVTIKSALGAGTTFTLRIPLASLATLGLLS